MIIGGYIDLWITDDCFRNFPGVLHMANYFETPIHWLDGTASEGRGLGNNVPWRCKCGETLLATYVYQPPPCPGCHRRFEVVRGESPRYVARVKETALDSR